MVSSKAESVSEYLESLPEDRRKAIKQVRVFVRKHLPKGYTEQMQYGMISWVIPLSRYAETYNNQALAVASLASQKQSMSLYLLGVYADERGRKRFEAAYAKSGKKLDMGKSCLRFKQVEDIALDVVGDALADATVERFIELYEKSRKR